MQPISPTIQRFLDLEKQKIKYKKYLEELNAALEAMVKEVGVNGYFQDPTDGTVFKAVIPDGRFVSFEKFGYKRTRRAYQGEKQGELSLKEAREAGFQIEE